jgi:phosphatidylglycerophosphate synthase
MKKVVKVMTTDSVSWKPIDLPPAATFVHAFLACALRHIQKKTTSDDEDLIALWLTMIQELVDFVDGDTARDY